MDNQNLITTRHLINTDNILIMAGNSEHLQNNINIWGKPRGKQKEENAENSKILHIKKEERTAGTPLRIGQKQVEYTEKDEHLKIVINHDGNKKGKKSKLRYYVFKQITPWKKGLNTKSNIYIKKYSFARCSMIRQLGPTW